MKGLKISGLKEYKKTPSQNEHAQASNNLKSPSFRLHSKKSFRSQPIGLSKTTIGMAAKSGTKSILIKYNIK